MTVWRFRRHDDGRVRALSDNFLTERAHAASRHEGGADVSTLMLDSTRSGRLQTGGADGGDRLSRRDGKFLALTGVVRFEAEHFALGAEEATYRVSFTTRTTLSGSGALDHIRRPISPAVTAVFPKFAIRKVVRQCVLRALTRNRAGTQNLKVNPVRGAINPQRLLVRSGAHPLATFLRPDGCGKDP
jgi:hypothetical protein